MTATTTKIVTAGTGAKLVTANSITFDYSLFNAKDGTQIETSFGKGTVPLDLSSTKLMKGLGKGLTGQLVGSRLLGGDPAGGRVRCRGQRRGRRRPHRHHRLLD